METITERIDAVTDIGQSHRGTVLPPPRSVKVEITSRCNYRCGFCVKSLREDAVDMDRELFSRIIREIRDAGVPELGLFYIGESFTCKWLPDAIREAKLVGFDYVFLTTNGAAALPSIVRKCMDAGLDSLKFSINFHSVDQLTEVARVPGHNFRKAIDHLKMARAIRDEEGYKTRIYASSIAFDGQQGERMGKVVNEILPYVDEHYYLPLYGMDGAAVNMGWQPRPGNPGRLDRMRDPLPCWAVFTEGHVTRTGDMVACCFGTGHDGALVMGNLREQSFMEAWNSPAYQELRAAHLALDVSRTACSGCAAGS